MKVRLSWVLAALALALSLFLYQQTNVLQTTRYSWESPRVPRAFDGYRIVQLSDLHNKRFGKHQRRLLRAVREAKPDLIALTGDFVDLHTKSLAAATELLEGMQGLAPMLYVDGNHDPNSPYYQEFLALLDRYGVIVLDGVTQLLRGGETMTIAGYGYWEIQGPAIAPADIVLYHGPQWFPAFAAAGCGLVLAGHIHGGQIALPGGRAIVGPAGTLFPEYSHGVYREGASTMVLSRGLGTSGAPLRLFSPPEIVVIELSRKAN